jgi:hypothetical protein
MEKVSISSFSIPGENRPSLCHFRSLMDRKQNLSFGFDPVTLTCSNCPARGAHGVGVLGGGVKAGLLS